VNLNSSFAAEVVDNGVYEGTECGVEYYTYRGKLYSVEVFPMGGIWIEQVKA